MGCVQPNRSPLPKVTGQSFDAKQNCSIEDRIQKKRSSSTRQNISTFEMFPQSISIQLPQRTQKMDKRTSLAPTQSSKQVNTDKKTIKNKSKDSDKTLSNQDSSNPQKNCQIMQKIEEIPSNTAYNVKQQKIDNSSILKKKSNLVRKTRSKSAPKKQKSQNQKSKAQQTKKKKVTIKIQDNKQQSCSSSLLFSDTQPSISKKVTHHRQPRGKSCNLFKTFENDFIEDQDEEYNFSRNIKSMTGIENKNYRK